MAGYKFISGCKTLLIAGLLTSCVTTTTGGFLSDASDEQAIQDYVQLALGYYDAGDMAGARRHINNALGISDRNSDVYTVLALIFQREGDMDLAEDNYKLAIRLDGTNSRARNNYAAMLFGLNRIDEAYRELQIVSNDTGYEGRAIAFENLGRSALRLNLTEEAELAFTRALQLNSNLFISALELAQLKSSKEDWVGARQNYQKYLTIVDFYKIPHTPRALLAGIQIEGFFKNEEMVKNFALILGTLYQDSPEYETYRSLSNAN